MTSSIEGLLSGQGSIIRLMSSSSYSDLYALGENLISPSRNLCHSRPFLGRFIPEANSRSVAPKLNMSAFYVIFYDGSVELRSSSGAM